VPERVVPERSPGLRIATVFGGFAVGVWALLGTGYGLALWLAAHLGYLPFPEPE